MSKRQRRLRAESLGRKIAELPPVPSGDISFRAWLNQFIAERQLIVTDQVRPISAVRQYLVAKDDFSEADYLSWKENLAEFIRLNAATLYAALDTFIADEPEAEVIIGEIAWLDRQLAELTGESEEMYEHNPRVRARRILQGVR